MITEDMVRDTLRGIVDPEVGVNIVDLGLVYNINIHKDDVSVAMTMTTRACPLGELITSQAEDAIKEKFPEATSITVEMVWDPPWDSTMMSDEARKILG